jgi:hypothetical protein
MSRPARAYFFGDHGPVWAASPDAARKRLARFPRIATSDVHELTNVASWMRVDAGLAAMGRPVFQGSKGGR